MATGTGFVWDARITMAPLMTAHVHDAYVNGLGILHAKLAGLIPVMDEPASRELSEGELMRYLAEAPWYPYRLLHSQSIEWQSLSETQVRVTLTDGPNAASVVYTFDDGGLVTQVDALRYRNVDEVMVETPWRGHFWNYETHNGMKIPMSGRVAWVIEGEPYDYWKADILSIAPGS